MKLSYLEELLYLQNPHWESGFFYPQGITRKITKKVMSYLNYPHIIALTGIRRAGKTTLMKQIINYLIEVGVPRRNILYFSYDELIADPLSLIKIWRRYTKPRGRHYYLFLDEVQRLSKWSDKIKTLYDHLELKIIISGSSSLHVKKGSSNLAGRIVEFEVTPLFFDEYLEFSNEEKSWEIYLRYLRRQLPELALYSLDSSDYIRNLVKKVIYEDATTLYRVEEPALLEQLFSIIERMPGQILRIEDLAKEFGRTRPTISKYLDILEKSLLIRKLYNFSKNARKIEVKAKKYYPYFTTLCAYHDTANLSQLAETEVVWKTNAEYFWNEKGKEIDVILTEPRLTAIEVKTTKKIDEKDIKNLLRFPYDAEKILVVPPHSQVNVTIKTVRLDELEEFLKT